jgi:hypothetical protein
MMLFDPEVGPSIKVEECSRKAGRQKKRLMSATVKTKENWSWGMLSGDHRRVILPQRLKNPMKLHMIMCGTSCTPHFCNLL